MQDSEYFYLANTYLAPVFELLFKDAVQIGRHQILHGAFYFCFMADLNLPQFFKTEYILLQGVKLVLKT